MGKNDRQSRDQKRKAKLRKRAWRSRKHESLAYSGKKYKTDEFVPVFYRTERGIYESYVMCDRELIDDEVEAAIERLVIQMREGPLPPLPATGVMTLTEGGEEDLIITNIRRNWRILEEKGELPGQDDLIGILRIDPSFALDLAFPEPGLARLPPLHRGLHEKAGRLGPASDAGLPAASRTTGGPAPFAWSDLDYATRMRRSGPSSPIRSSP